MAARDVPASDIRTLVKDASVLRRLATAGRLQPGELPKKTLTIKAAEATRVLKEVIRFVADVSAGTSPIVVWTQDGSELWVDISTVLLDAAPGLLRVGIRSARPAPGPRRHHVPFASAPRRHPPASSCRASTGSTGRRSSRSGGRLRSRHSPGRLSSTSRAGSARSSAPTPAGTR